MTTQYYVEEFTDDREESEDDDLTWDALDWCYLVKKESNEIVCICATDAEARHICSLLIQQPLP